MEQPAIPGPREATAPNGTRAKVTPGEGMRSKKGPTRRTSIARGGLAISRHHQAAIPGGDRAGPWGAGSGPRGVEDAWEKQSADGTGNLCPSPRHGNGMERCRALGVDKVQGCGRSRAPG